MFCLIRPPAVATFRLVTSNIAPPLGPAYVAAAVAAAGLCSVYFESAASAYYFSQYTQIGATGSAGPA